MSRGLSLAAFFALVAVPTTHSQPPTSEPEIYDGFETKDLSGIWSTAKFESGALVVQPDVVRAGKSAAKITIHQGDRSDAADPSTNTNENERDELLERKDLWTPEEKAYSYAFSIFIPKDFPIVSTRLVLAQWKQWCPEKCNPENPVVALRYVGGVLSVTLQTSDEKVTLYRTKEDAKGKWLDFSFHFRFARTENGFVNGWLNGQRIIKFAGRTAYNGGGYEPRSRFYFKMGLYRDRMVQPMTVYIDEYRKRAL